MSGIELSSVRAIDVHVHVESSIASDPESRVHPVHGFPLPTVPELADLSRSLKIAAVVFPVDSPFSLGQTITNEEVAELAAEAADVLIPFGSIDPVRRMNAPAIARRLITEHGVRGFKFHPAVQGFYPNDPLIYPLYAVLEELGVPALFHTGQVGGGSGARLKFCDPIYLDDVAVDFPGLTIVMAHPSYPWQNVALSIAGTRPNAYIDLSGWSPRYFPPELIHQSNTILKEKVMFGSDYPVISPERWLTDFEKAEFRNQVRPGILKSNAARVLRLS